jgi:RNA polymerase subunit RPABC4/transcription elongation factor Spt4
MQTLKYGDIVLGLGRRQTFGSVSGYMRESGVTEVEQRISESIQRGHKLVWLNAMPSIISAHPQCSTCNTLTSISCSSCPACESRTKTLENGDVVRVESEYHEEAGLYFAFHPQRMTGDNAVLTSVKYVAKRKGEEAGKAAASWYEINSEDPEAIERMLHALDNDIDPAYEDELPTLDLSGQWADGPTEGKILIDIGLDLTDTDEITPEERDELIEIYRDAHDSTARDEVIASLRAQLAEH